MMGARDMQRYIILKSIKNAKSDKDLEKYLLRAKVNFILCFVQGDPLTSLWKILWKD